MDGDFSYLEMVRDVISAGWALSLRSNAVCMVSLLLKTSWRSHLYPVGIQKYTLNRKKQDHQASADECFCMWCFLWSQFPYWSLSWGASHRFSCKKTLNSCSQPTCFELVKVSRVCVGGLKRLRYWALAWIRRRVRNLSLAFRVVDKHKAVLLINAERVWPAVRVIRAAVHGPGGTCSGWRPLRDAAKTTRGSTEVRDKVSNTKICKIYGKKKHLRKRTEKETRSILSACRTHSQLLSNSKRSA